MCKFITIVPRQSAATGRNPEKTPPVLVNIINIVVQQTIIHSDIGNIVAGRKQFLRPGRMYFYDKRNEKYYAVFECFHGELICHKDSAFGGKSKIINIFASITHEKAIKRTI
jgi:hypothetical protein